jgi:hypothetical protein
MSGGTRAEAAPTGAEALGRRSFLGKAAVAGAVAWAAPVIVSRPALADGTCLFTPRLLAGGGNTLGDFVVVSNDPSPRWQRSNDGGVTWAAAATPPPSTFVPTLLAGGGNGTGNAGSNFVATNGSGQWYRTADGGQTWTPTTVAGNPPGGPGAPFNATLLAGWGSAGGGPGNGDFVAFRPLAATALQAARRWRYSLDGGATWAAPSTPPLSGFTPTLLAGGGDNASSPGDFVALDGVTGRLYNSTNGGASWTERPAATNGLGAPPTGTQWTLLAGGDDINGCFVVTNGAGAWRHSVDGGTSWATPTTPAGGPPISAIVLAGGGDNDGVGTDGDFVAASATGQWWRSLDGGVTWAAPTTPPPAGFVTELLAGVGDAEGGGPDGGNDFVAYGHCAWYRSTDGGTTWSLIVAPPS